VDTGVYVSTMRRLKDYEMLAFACRRGGKIRDEGRSYYSIGVLYDNIQKYHKAVEYYEKFLQVCKSIGDSHGEALAYNCIGVDYQMLGEKDVTHIEKAVEYHNKHEQLADTNGKFLASINLGLCYDRLGDYKNSVYWYQSALKHSVKMSNLVGQSLAIGNIGKIGAKGLNENKDKMKVFVEKYLKLAKEMRDEKGEMNGCLKLGLISGSKKNFEEGRENFLRAL
jgi:tetratricopeptide (TPR) repeat protein